MTYDSVLVQSYHISNIEFSKLGLNRTTYLRTECYTFPKNTQNRILYLPLHTQMEINKYQVRKLYNDNQKNSLNYKLEWKELIIKRSAKLNILYVKVNCQKQTIFIKINLK